MRKCKYPNCKGHATKTWALVPLCEGHFETIQTETTMFYKRAMSRNSVSAESRVHYLKIKPFTPWGNKSIFLSSM